MFNQNIVDLLNNSGSEFTSTTHSDRRNALVGAVEATKGNILRAMDLMLIHDEDFRNEFNYEAKKQGKSGVAYPVLARGLFEAGQIDEKTFQRAAGVLDTITNPGGLNFLQTTVADFIAETVEELGLVAKEVNRIDLAGEGNLLIPTFNPKLSSTWVANSAQYAELTALEGGINGVTLNPQKVGAFVTVRPDFLNKLSANRLTFILRILADAQARAYDLAILNGTGSGVQPTGMNQNSLNVTTHFEAGANAFDTLLNAMSAVSDRRAGRNRDMRIFMNTAAKNEFVKLERSLSNDRTNILETGVDSMTIGGNKVIITDAIVNTNGTAPANKTSVVTVGYANQYYWGESAKPKVQTDHSIGFLSGNTVIRVDGMADGKPAFNDAFAKFTVTTGVEST